jgi:transposase
MYTVGIDISKGRSTAAVLGDGKKIIRKSFDVNHNERELTEFAENIKSYGEVCAIMEHTGQYYRVVAERLTAAGISVYVVNPKLIHDYGNNSLRKVKNDRKDAVKIARYGIDNSGELREFTPDEKIREVLKSYSRQLALYIKVRTQLENNLISMLDLTFPGINELFSSSAREDGHQKWVDFANLFWHSHCVCKLSKAKFTEKYRKFCKKNRYDFSETKASDIYDFAANCAYVMPKNEQSRVLVVSAIKQVIAVSVNVENTRKQMIELAKQLPEFDTVSEMYGVGETTAAQLMAEIGDVRRFENRGSLVAFAGIDPSENKSGKSNPDGGKISKNGRPALRQALFQIMLCYVMTSPADEPIYQFIDKKRGEGKHYYVYMTAGANKFLRIYYAMVGACLRQAEEKIAV